MKKIIACLLVTMNVNMMALWSTDTHLLTEKERRCVTSNLITLKNYKNQTPEQIDKVINLVFDRIKADGGNQALMHKVLLDEFEFETDLFRRKLCAEKNYLPGLSSLAAGVALACAVYLYRNYAITQSAALRKELGNLGVSNIQCDLNGCSGEQYYFGHLDISDIERIEFILSKLTLWEGQNYYSVAIAGGFASLCALLKGVETIDHERRPDFHHKGYSLVRDLLKKRIELCHGGDNAVSVAE